MMEKTVYRHEEKYLLSYGGYRYLENLLGSVMTLDSNAAGPGAYYIRSLYFDTCSNREYYEKSSGIYERRKIRLRIYDTEAISVKLEMKAKAGSGILKESLAVSRQEAARLIAGDGSFLEDYQEPAAGKLYRILKSNFYRPAVVIDYERTAYVLPVFSVRVTFDKNVRAHMGGGGFWDGRLPMASLLDGSKVVLEVKYTEMLPGYIKQLLATVPKVPVSFSKYCRCRQLVG